MFRSVVFPAPLGPITEMISPFCTSRLTRVTAWTPPNALDTASIWSCVVIGLLPSPSSRIVSGASRQPSLAAPVVLEVPVALALPDAREPKVELADVLIVADRLPVPVEHDAAVLHDVGVLRDPERHRGVLLGEEHGHALL